MSEKDTVTQSTSDMKYYTDKMQMMSCSHGANKRRFEFKSRMKGNRLIQPNVITFLYQRKYCLKYIDTGREMQHINAHRHSGLGQT